MLWINSSQDTVSFIMDLGKGRRRFTLLPSETIELPESYRQALYMEAPQMVPCEHVDIPDQELDIQEIEQPKPTPAKRGRKSNKAN